MMRVYRIFGLAMVLVFLGITLTGPALAKDYYKGKTLTLIIPHSPGGGTDTFARVLARHLPRFIPGKPNVIVKNMPGGAGMLAPNYVARAARKDGLTALVGSSFVSGHDLLRTEGVKFDYAEMPMSLICPAGEVYVVRPEKCPKPTDIVKNAGDIVFGYGPMPIGQTMCWMLAKELFGMESKKDVLGFSGSGDSRRAYLSGEIDLYAGSNINYVANDLPYVKEGDMIPLWQSGLHDAEGNLNRSPGPLADIFTIDQLYEEIFGEPPSGPYWKAIDAYIFYCRTMNKPMSFPAGTEKYAAIVRDAAAKMAQDPQFQKDFERINPGVDLVVGDDVPKLVARASERVKEVRSWLQDWINEGWGLEFQRD